MTSVVLLTPPDEGPRVKGRRFELEDIFGPDFQPLRSNGSWISGKIRDYNLHAYEKGYTLYVNQIHVWRTICIMRHMQVSIYSWYNA